MVGWLRGGWAFCPLVLICLYVVTTDAVASSCDPVDDDRDGVITTSDLEPLFDDFAKFSGCMDADLARAIQCSAYDVDGDATISFVDFAAVRDLATLYVACGGSLDPREPECDALDGDGDGLVDFANVMEAIAFTGGCFPCLGADLSLLSCQTIDYDADELISSMDFSEWSQRFVAAQRCLGTRLETARGLWIDHDRLMSLPTHGPAWERVFQEATKPYVAPDLSDQNDGANTRTLAKALVGVRLGRSDLVDDVVRGLRSVTDDPSDAGARSLAPSRLLAAYVIAADVIGLAQLDPTLDARFRERLRTIRVTDYLGRTIVSTHEMRPNNWGTHAGAARIAIAIYLGDDADLAAAAAVHRAWVGEPGDVNPAFRFGALDWQADPSRPIGINPRGASAGGIDLDGAQPEEMRRGGPLASPPGPTGYPWEALQGATVAAELLARHGYPDAWVWGDDALVRAVDYLFRLDRAHGGWWATGDDRWIVWLVNRATGRAYPTEVGVSPGKNMGFTDWTHAD